MAKSTKIAVSPAATPVSSAPATAGSGSTSTSTGSATASPVNTGKAAKGFRLKLQLMLAGVQSVIPDGSQIGSITDPMAKADIVTTLTNALTAYSAVDAAVTATDEARLQVNDNLAPTKTYYQDLVVALKQQFGANSPQLNNFGIKPKQPPKPISPEKLVARKVKTAQTKGMRGTLTKAEKAQLQFQGQVQVSTSISGANSSASTSSPAPSPTAPAPAPAAAPAAAAVAPKEVAGS